MKRSHQHTIDFLFPIALFFVFSATALMVLLLSANIYQSVVNSSNTSFEQGTSLAYITGKIRQNDAGGTNTVYITEFHSYDCLAIEQEYAGNSYVTYIYEAEGELKELFLQKGVEASAAAGTTVMEAADLKMQEVSDGLFQFTCTSKNGTSDSVLVSVHSDTL